MKKHITVLGSCVSRDVFTQKLNTNWRKYFNLERVSFQSTVISLVAEKSNTQEYGCNEFVQRTIDQDFQKVFIKSMSENKSKVLLIDLFADINFGVIKSLENEYITNNPQTIGTTGYYKKLNMSSKLSVDENTLDYIREFNKSAVILANIINSSKIETVIFNYYKPATHYKLLNNMLISFKLRKQIKSIKAFGQSKQEISPMKQIYFQKQLFSILEYHLTVKTIKKININSKGEYVASKQHPFGLSSVHFEDNYYHDFLRILVESS